MGSTWEASETLQRWIRGLEKFGDRPCVICFNRDGSGAVSFVHLVTQVRRLSAGLERNGLSRGDRAVLYAPASVAWIIACFAVIHTGAVPVPIDSQMTGEELTHVFDDTSASWVFTNEAGQRRLEESGLDERSRLILLDGSRSERGWEFYFSSGAPDKDPPESAESQPHDPAVIFYTSGTTGVPKGVPLTHGNLFSNLRAISNLHLIGAGDCLLLPLPLHHAYPFTVGLLTPLGEGVPIVLPMSLVGSEVMRAMREARVTVVVSMPRFYAALYAGLETQLRRRGRLYLFAFRCLLEVSMLLRKQCGVCIGRWLFSPLHTNVAPKLRFVASGGAELEPGLAWKVEALGWRVASGYGLTETSPILTFNRPGEGIGTAGQPLPGVDVRIADPEPDHEHGEVQVKGGNVFSGYLHLDEETREAFTDDGYFRTGDLGYFEHGRLKLSGRASTTIVLSAGENLQPERIEDVLRRAAHIREAAVLKKDGRLVALVVPETNIGDSQERLLGCIAAEAQEQSASLPSHHRITDFALTREPLPRTRLGKLRRHELDRLFVEAKKETDGAAVKGPVPADRMAPEDRQLLDDPVARDLWKWLAERFPDARLAPETNLGAELGIDSMAWLSLTLDITEAAGVDLSEQAIGRIETVRDLLREAAVAHGVQTDSRDLYQKLQRPEELLSEEQQRWLAPPSLTARLFGKFLLMANRAVMRSFFSLEVHGAENLPNAPCVLTPNHLSYLDAPAMAAALPIEYLRCTYWTGWTGVMFRNRFMRAVSRATRVLPIDVQRRVLSSLAFAVSALQRGSNLVWFAEGHISADGELQPFQPGIGYVLAAKSVLVVPVRVEGTREALPREKWWPRRHPIGVTFGKAIDCGEFLANRGEEAQRELIELLHQRLAALYPG